MKKRLLIFLIGIWSITSLEAQLMDGTVCPNFTAVDLQGNSWDLYQLLDNNQRVVLNFFTAWDATSWSYYQSAELQRLDSTWGSLGSNEVKILFIEMESANGNSQLYGPANNCNDVSIATAGDWVTSNPFPIIDSAALGNLLGVGYLPTIYCICPDRLIYEAGQYSSSVLEDFIFQSRCEPAVHTVDPMLVYALPTTDCSTGQSFLTVGIKNFGTEPLTSASLQLTDGTSIFPLIWDGSLETYESDEISFGPMELGYQRNFELTVSSADANSDNSTLSFDAGLVLSSDSVSLDLLLDGWPSEFSWSILDGDGNVVHQSEEDYVSYQLIQKKMALPGDGCYTLRLLDSGGDGLQGSLWGGFDGHFSLKSRNWLGEWIYSIIDYNGSYGFDELIVEFEVNNELALDVEPEPVVMNSLRAYPNPTARTMWLEYNLPASTDVSLEWRDSMGKLVMNQYRNHQSAGRHQELIDLGTLPTGIYFLTLSYSDYRSTIRVIKQD